MGKYFITAQSLLEDSFALARKILDSEFRPTFIIALWRGGTPVGSVVQEFLKYKGISSDHIAIRTSAYEGLDTLKKQVSVHGLGYVIDRITAEDTLLIVDDVFDTGLSMQAVLEALERRARKNLPHDIRVATVYYKPKRNKTRRVPDYYIHETDDWLVFPHELEGLTIEEIRKGKGEVVTALLKP